jgi:hypothetical protein
MAAHRGNWGEEEQPDNSESMPQPRGEQRGTRRSLDETCW